MAYLPTHSPLPLQSFPSSFFLLSFLKLEGERCTITNNLFLTFPSSYPLLSYIYDKALLGVMDTFKGSFIYLLVV